MGNFVFLATSLDDLSTVDIDEAEVRRFFSSLSMDTVLPAIITFVLCLAISHLIMAGMNRMLTHSRIEKTIHGILRTLTRVFLYMLTIMITASQLGVEISSLLAIFSIAALAISLAIQGALSNLASGIVILSSHPFKVGDFIEVGSVKGTVQEIDLTYTKMATPDNKLVFVPNSEITATTVTNYTAGERRRVDIEVAAAYDCPVGAVKASLYASADAVDKILAEPSPVVYVTAYQSCDIQYTLRVWVEVADYWDVYFALLEQVKRDFDDENIHMTYPHMRVHLEQSNCLEGNQKGGSRG